MKKNKLLFCFISLLLTFYWADYTWEKVSQSRWDSFNQSSFENNKLIETIFQDCRSIKGIYITLLMYDVYILNFMYLGLEINFVHIGKRH